MIKCPRCNGDMTFDRGAYYCNDNSREDSYSHRPIILCKCEHHMIPDAKYNKNKRGFDFWKCPHCFNRW